MGSGILRVKAVQSAFGLFDILDKGKPRASGGRKTTGPMWAAGLPKECEMTLAVALQLLLLGVIGICLIALTVTLHSTLQTARQFSKEATRTLEEGRQLLHRANRATHGLEKWVDRTRGFFTGRFFGNGARAGPRRGVVKR